MLYVCEFPVPSVNHGFILNQVLKLVKSNPWLALIVVKWYCWYQCKTCKKEENTNSTALFWPLKP